MVVSFSHFCVLAGTTYGGLNVRGMHVLWFYFCLLCREAMYRNVSLTAAEKESRRVSSSPGRTHLETWRCDCVVLCLGVGLIPFCGKRQDELEASWAISGYSFRL